MQHNVSVTQRHNNEPDIFINFHSYIEEVYFLMLMTESVLLMTVCRVLIAAVNKQTTTPMLHFFNNCFSDEFSERKLMMQKYSKLDPTLVIPEVLGQVFQM